MASELATTTPSPARAARAAAVTIMIESFGRKLSKPMLDGYEFALADIDPGIVRQAVARHLRAASDHPASPGRLRELCGVTSPDDRALLAWDVVAASTGIGSYRSVDFDDGLTNATIRSMGGWPALLDRGGENFDVWARKTFTETYAAYCRSGVNGDSCRPLPGLSATGEQQVRNRDGTMATITMRPPERIETGLPAMDQTVAAIEGGSVSKTLGIELKKP